LHSDAAAIGYGIGGTAEVDVLGDGVTCQVELQRRAGGREIVVFQKKVGDDLWHDMANVTLGASAARAFVKANANFDGDGYLRMGRKNRPVSSSTETQPQIETQSETGGSHDAAYKKGYACAIKGSARLRAEGKTTASAAMFELCYTRTSGAFAKSYNKGVDDGYRAGGVLGVP
jgi:hypothetical protein